MPVGMWSSLLTASRKSKAIFFFHGALPQSTATFGWRISPVPAAGSESDGVWNCGASIPQLRAQAVSVLGPGGLTALRHCSQSQFSCSEESVLYHGLHPKDQQVR